MLLRLKALTLFAIAYQSCFAPLSSAKQVQLDVAMAHPAVLISEDGSSTNHLRIGLTGFDLPSEKKRMPINVAIVIDKSGSMQGDKIEQARQAALQAVDRLNADDIISIVTYDTSIEVLVPATKATDRESIRQKIRTIQPGGNTALFAGVSKGADEVRKFLDDNRVNRVILLSDGLANVGPQSPEELETLGTKLMDEGISVSTMGLGLGYNEDLMSRLAMASSGNHVFIEDAENLVKVFEREFDDVLSVVAQKLQIKATLAEGVRPVKVLNQKATIDGQCVTIELGQLYSNQERYFVVEVELPSGQNGSTLQVATVALEYLNMVTETTDQITSSVEVRFTDSKELAESSVNKEVLGSCVIQIANENNRLATELRDAGKVEEARSALLSNALFLDTNYKLLGLEQLKARCELNTTQASNLDDRNWAANRKAMRESQLSDATQQSYGGSGEKSDYSNKP